MTMNYIDTHCDSVTASCKKGENLTCADLQASSEKLKKSECLLQCFALFTQGENAAKDFERFLAFYNAQTAIDPHICPVYCISDVKNAQKEGKVGALLTVENLGFLDDLGGIEKLKRAGVAMASLVWNDANRYAYPNLIIKDGLPRFEEREMRGLTGFGKTVVEMLNENAIIADVSHLSDGGFDDVLNISTAPVVASHSNCSAVCNVSRNLTDAQIKRIADSGGTVGLNYCRAFVIDGAANDELNGTNSTKNESVFEWLYRHYTHLVNVGGEDVAALGSDFDGIQPYAELPDCTAVPKLLKYFKDRGVTQKRLEKLAYKNFLRVLESVLG